jgi:hypothetical protein
MDVAAIKRDLLLKEYAEAGQIARQHEQLSRTSVSVFVPVLLALLGYLLGANGPHGAKLGLAFTGLLLSLLVANLVRRHQLYYRSYIARARAIEAALQVEEQQVIRLYTDGKGAIGGSYTISNKTALTVILLVGTTYFGVAVVVYGYRLICGP